MTISGAGRKDLTSWSIIAQNLPEHARNPIHTDAGAQAAGFPRALVAGVTTYAYMTHPVVAAWGIDWLKSGGGEFRFRKPVFDKAEVRCEPTNEESGVRIDVLTAESVEPRAFFNAVGNAGPLQPLRDGEKLEKSTYELGGVFGSDYGARAGDDFLLYRETGIIHPAVWPALANDVVYNQVARGSWIHMRSIVRHHAIAYDGTIAEVDAVVVRRFEAHGERAIIDVHISVDGEIVASLEHEAIVALPKVS